MRAGEDKKAAGPTASDNAKAAAILEEALAAARKVEEPERKALALRDVAAAQAKAGLKAESRRTFGEAVAASRDLEPILGNYRGQAWAFAAIAGTQAEAGFFAEAFETARGIRNPAAKAGAYAQIAGVQAKRGLWAEALATAERIAKKDQKALALAAIAAARSKERHFTEAVAVVRRIEMRDTRVEALCEIARAQAEAGHADEARPVLAEAIATAVGSTDADWKARTLSGIADVQAGARLFAEAVTAVQKHQVGDTRAKSLIEIAMQQAEAAGKDEAGRILRQVIDTARGIKDSQARASALWATADAQAKVGQARDASHTAEEALTATRTIKSPYQKSWLLSHIAATLAKAGQAGRARQLLDEAVAEARGIEANELSRAEALRDVATVQAEAGFVAEAHATVGKIEDAEAILKRFRGSADSGAFYVKAAALGAIAAAEAKAGRFAEALATARSIKDQGRRAGALLGLADAQWKAGKAAEARQAFDEGLAAGRGIGEKEGASLLFGVFRDELEAGRLAEALAVAKVIDEVRLRAFALGWVATKHAEKGQANEAQQVLVEALDTAHKIADAQERVEALALIASAQAKAGRPKRAGRTFAEAMAAAGQIKAPDFKSSGGEMSAIAEVASAQLEAGFLADAIASTRQIKSPGERARVFCDISRAQTQAEQAEQARQSLAEALDAARMMEDGSSTLEDIAKMQIGEGLMAESLVTAEQIKDAHRRSQSLCDVAAAQAERGLADQAKQIFAKAMAAARLIDRLPAKERMLYAIAQAERKAGLTEEADRTTNEAVAASRQVEAEGVSRSPGEPSPLSELATAQVKKGELAAALATTRGIKDVRLRVAALCEVAVAHAQAKQQEQARQVFNEAKQTGELCEVAAAQYKAGLAEDARRTFAEAVAEAVGKKSSYAKARAIETIAAAAANLGQTSDARQIFADTLAACRRIEDREDKGDALRVIAAAQVKAGLADEARKAFGEAVATVRTMPDGEQKAAAFHRIAISQTEADLLADAMATFREIEEGAEKMAVLQSIVDAQCRAGLTGRAEQNLAETIAATRKMADSSDKAEMLTWIARTQLWSGHKEEARQTLAEAIVSARRTEDKSRVETLREAASVQAQAGLAEEARKTFVEARTVACKMAGAEFAYQYAFQDGDSSSPRVQALSQIATAQAGAKFLEDALATARQIDDAYIKSYTLCELAGKLEARKSP